ncbi:MAG: TIGR03768 family metallophosphoesterase [Methylococcaceae bacterium]
MLRSIILYLVLSSVLFTTNVFAQGTPAQNGVTATGGVTSGSSKYIVVRWTNTCTVCSWRLSHRRGNDPWISLTLSKGITQHTIQNLQPGVEYSVKLEAKRAARWVERALLTVAPAATTVFTTRQKTVVPDSAPWGINPIFPWDVQWFPQYGYGSWYYGPGLQSVKRTDIMQAGYSGPLRNTASLLNFFAMTDIHISDKESPSQVMELAKLYVGDVQYPVSSTYSPVMLYTTQVLNAVVQTVNALHKIKPFDFGIALGDAINSTQGNELRWYLDVLDGKFIYPSSGDHAGAGTIDYQKPFKAAGLNMPWYQGLGNHDHFFIGSYPVAPTPKLQNSYTSASILKLGDVFLDPINAVNENDFYMGTVNGSTRYGDLISAGCVKVNPSVGCASAIIAPEPVVADPGRKSLTRKEWMQAFLTSTSKPKGHGFTQQANVGPDFASYSFVPKPGVPIKVIVLDDTQVDSNANLPESPLWGHAYLDEPRYKWLVGQLEAGQKNNQLMIIAAHIPIGVEGYTSSGWYPKAYPNSQAAFIAKLNTYSNLILWISGHRHYNVVTPFPSPNPNHPELGFWQVETSSTRDFPQQFRTFEIVRNSDNTLSIFATDVDTLAPDGSLAAISRSYAIAAQQLYNNQLPLLPTASYNAELVKQLNPTMQGIIQNLPAR